VKSIEALGVQQIRHPKTLWFFEAFCVWRTKILLLLLACSWTLRGLLYCLVQKSSTSEPPVNCIWLQPEQFPEVLPMKHEIAGTCTWTAQPGTG